MLDHRRALDQPGVDLEETGRLIDGGELFR